MGVPKILEKHFQTAVLKKLRALPNSYWIKINDRVTLGLPDIIGCINGYYVAMELKTQTKVTRLQAHTLARMNKAGAFVFVTTPKTWDADFEEIIKYCTR